MNTKRIARCALFTTAALILSLLENALPPLLSFAPGTKIGLSNAVTLVALMVLGYGDAYLVLIARCLLAALFAGNPASLMYAAPAGLISLTLQIILYHFFVRRISLMSISLCGAVAHNTVQLTVAGLVVQTNLLPMLPLTLAASVLAGLTVGAVAFFTVKLLPERFYKSLLSDKPIKQKEKTL